MGVGTLSVALSRLDDASSKLGVCQGGDTAVKSACASGERRRQPVDCAFSEVTGSDEGQELAVLGRP